HRYARALDLLDRSLFESCFTDPVEVAFPTWKGEVRSLSPVQFADHCWRIIAGFTATQHSLSNHYVEFRSPEEATCLSYLRAMHYIAEDACDSYVVAGHY